MLPLGQGFDAAPRSIVESRCVLRNAAVKRVRAGDSSGAACRVVAVVDRHVGVVGDLLQLARQIVIIAERIASQTTKSARPNLGLDKEQVRYEE